MDTTNYHFAQFLNTTEDHEMIVISVKDQAALAGEQVTLNEKEVISSDKNHPSTVDCGWFANGGIPVEGSLSFYWEADGEKIYLKTEDGGRHRMAIEQGEDFCFLLNVAGGNVVIVGTAEIMPASPPSQE